MPQDLNGRDAGLFRTLSRLVEEKQYKKALKTAEQLLKKNPKHAETTSMKALIFEGQGKVDDAFALAKEAVGTNMRSQLCWHIYGILYKNRRNYDEAIKAYKFALKLEPEAHLIQRDLASLQIQTRDYQGYIQSRDSMMRARPNIRQNWTALAIAHHLAGDLETAERLLTTFEQSRGYVPSRTDFENSEAVLYKNSIIAESGDIGRALEHLQMESKHNLDRLAVMELRAHYFSQLGRKEEAIKAIRALLDRNPDHPQYYKDLIRELAIDEKNETALKAVYDEYAAKFPRSDIARRGPLDFLTGTGFKSSAESYLSSRLDKGVPSTFANLKILYNDPTKKDTLETLALEYLRRQQSQSSDGKAERNGSQGEGAALYYLAQHYDYHLSRDLAKAMEYVDKALALCPKNVDFAMTKARIIKHQGDLQKASEAMDQARLLDTKDRYINSKAAKYQLRNNQNEKALETMEMFTRKDAPGGPLYDLIDMQANWYLIEDGEAWARRGNVRLALKRFHTVYDIFSQWVEDQYDFHTFSLRKGQVRAYIDMIRWEDRLRAHPFYARASLSAIKVYLGMYDKSQLVNGVNGGVEGQANGTTVAEAKKAAKKAKKEALKAEREAAEKAAKQDPNKPQKSKEELLPPKRDNDPDGLKLAATQDPMGEATKFLVPLLEFNPSSLEAQLLGFEVYIRRKKFVLALRSLKAAQALVGKDDGRVKAIGSTFSKVVTPIFESLDIKAQAIIKPELQAA